ncbi:acetyl-CoA carboxylase biotin carboxylase subunit family protein [Chloroflexota bacterium]
MNVIMLSPHFPPNYVNFSVRLRQLGVTVLGLADEPYENLIPELKEALVEYYAVDDMHNYDLLLRACGYFTHRHGKIDRFESHNEYWLETDARIRTDFNIYGIKNDEIKCIRQKSLMKKTFEKAGVPVARGLVVRTRTQAKRFVQEVGYPVVAKPDAGVGAAATFKIHDHDELESFFAQKPDVDYIMEEFIEGTICTFDGLTDRDGNPVFYTSHVYSVGVMETVNDALDIYYYSLREIPSDLEEAGRRTLNAFDVRERFFHFEFFRTPEGRLVALEVNMRPPGGLTTDMFNYANDIDIYREWANVVVFNRFTADYARPYHCCYVGRRFHHTYARPHTEVLSTLGPLVVHHEQINSTFGVALGDYGYLVRSPDLDEIHAAARYIHELA